MARVAVEKQALNDPRFVILGDAIGESVSDRDVSLALGLLFAVRVWDYCSDRGKLLLTKKEVDAFNRNLSTALVEADLAVVEDGLLRIRGGQGRLDWLQRARSNGAKGASHGAKGAEFGGLGGRPRKTPHPPVSETPPPGDTKTPPLTLTPTLTPTTSPESPSDPPPTYRHNGDSSEPRERAPGAKTKIPKRAPATKAKPTPLIDPEYLAVLEERFTRLWTLYPRKVGKEAAWAAFTKLDPDVETLRAIASDLRRRVDSGEWDPIDRERKRFILHLSTYLNQRRWTDEEES